MDCLSTKLETLPLLALSLWSEMRPIWISSSERSWILQYTENRIIPTNTRMLTVSKVLILRATAMKEGLGLDSSQAQKLPVCGGLLCRLIPGVCGGWIRARWREGQPARGPEGDPFSTADSSAAGSRLFSGAARASHGGSVSTRSCTRWLQLHTTSDTTLCKATFRCNASLPSNGTSRQFLSPSK